MSVATLMTAAVMLAVGTVVGMGLAYQRLEAKLAVGALAREVQTMADMSRSIDFWRTQALACRTDGVDSLRPVPEGKR